MRKPGPGEVRLFFPKSVRDELQLGASFYATKRDRRVSMSALVVALLRNDPEAVLSLQEAQLYMQQAPGEFELLRKGRP